jgi:CRISPR-associated endonuclease/helicase Cas3
MWASILPGEWDSIKLAELDIPDYRSFFLRLTGNVSYRWQEELGASLLSGQSVVLRAPTGSGKTWATVAPFLYAKLANPNGAFADRLIYALPLRSLASGLHRVTVDAVKKLLPNQLAVATRGRDRRYAAGDPIYITIQSGNQQDDPFFEGDVVFTTIDQLLSSYLFAPVSLPERVANIGAGALLGSLVVFDEIHLLDPARSLATAIEMLDRLKNLAQFVLMSATLPESVFQRLARQLAARARSLTSEEVLRLPSHAHKRRNLAWMPRPLTAEDVAGRHTARTIVLVNSVSRAQEIFCDLRQKLGNCCSRPPKLLLLHSRYYPEDREHCESQLDDYFGPNASRTNAILICTQVIEAGMDISADVMLTEIAPLNALIQRAGRVARYAHRNNGEFLVFELPIDNAGRFALGPYRDQAEAVSATRSLLASLCGQQSLDYFKELEWLDAVHGESDLLALSHLDSLHSHREKVLRAMDGLDASACSRLIRDIDSVGVIVTNSPESLAFDRGLWPQLLSVPRTSLFRLRGACAVVQAPDWIFRTPTEITSNPAGGLDIVWQQCTDPAKAGWLLAIHPAHARYSREIGLQLETRSDTEPDVRYRSMPPLPRYSYARETYVAHAHRTVEQARRIIARLPSMMMSLQRARPDVSFSGLAELACALHDAGKLQVEWQAEAHNWQQYCDSRTGIQREINEPLAHTSYEPSQDKGNALLPKFPAHAACGAFALLPYLARHFPAEIVLVMCTTIARHHGAHTRELRDFRLPETVTVPIEASLPENAPRPLIPLTLRPNSLDVHRFTEQYLVHLSEDENCWPLYVGLARILRLADQGSIREG